MNIFAFGAKNLNLGQHMSVKGNITMASLLITVIIPFFHKGNSIFYFTKSNMARYKNLMTYKNEINEHLLIGFM